MNFVDYSRLIGEDRGAPSAVAERVAIRIGRIRYQLAIGLLFGVVVPLLLRTRIEQWPDAAVHYDNSVLGTVVAVLIGFTIFRKVSVLPGAGSFVNIVPAFVSSYSIVMISFFALRLDYSRAQFAVSILLVIASFYAIAFLMSRFRHARFVLVTNRVISQMRPIRGVEWVHAKQTATAETYRHLPIVVDHSSVQLTEDWERYLAEEAISGRLIYDRQAIVEALRGRVPLPQTKGDAESALSLRTLHAPGHLVPDSIYAPAKRYLDLLMAIVVLLLLSPVLCLTAVAIRLESPGPVLFKQSRMGYRGRPFTMLKFRSMRFERRVPASSDADMTLTDDQRITRVGRFIRRTRIDELPQIINIIRGEMSWIGPRPETLRLSEWYESEIPFYRYRHIVRPGITGWAQVNQGHVTSVEDVREKLEFDFYYVKHFTLWTDLLILVKTVIVVLTGHGSK